MNKTIKRGSRGNDVKVLQQNLSLYIDGIFGELTEEVVKEFQASHDLTVDGIVGPKTWKAIQELPEYKGRYIDKIIVHCAATPEDRDFTTADIKRWHLQRGFSDIGYHYVIYRDGSIHEGRDINISGAHTSGHNSNSIGVCYIGGMDADNKKAKDTRTEEQKESLINLLTELKEKYPKAKIYGHREFANKACPSFDAREEYKNISEYESTN